MTRREQRLSPRAGPLASNIRVDGRRTQTLILLRSISRTGPSTWDICKCAATTNDLSNLGQTSRNKTNVFIRSRLWHGLVTFGCAITIPEEEAEETKELLRPALIAASLTNDLFSFEKERDDVNVQNAVLVVMREHDWSEAEAREILKDRIRIEVANYVRVVKETRTRSDISNDMKRYIEIIQYTLSGNLAWSTQCPRYNAGAKWNELQLLRAKHGVEKYPARWPPKVATDGLSAAVEGKEPHVNGDEVRHHESTKTNGHKRKRNGDGGNDEMRMNGTTNVKKFTQTLDANKDSLISRKAVSLALVLNLPDLNDDVSSTHCQYRFPCNLIFPPFGAVNDGDHQVVLEPYRYLSSLPSKGVRDQAIDSLNTWLKVPPKSAKMIKNVVKMLHGASLMYVFSTHLG